jgi:hypothetical protein
LLKSQTKKIFWVRHHKTRLKFKCWCPCLMISTIQPTLYSSVRTIKLTRPNYLTEKSKTRWTKSKNLSAKSNLRLDTWLWLILKSHRHPTILKSSTISNIQLINVSRTLEIQFRAFPRLRHIIQDKMPSKGHSYLLTVSLNFE